MADTLFEKIKKALDNKEITKGQAKELAKALRAGVKGLPADEGDDADDDSEDDSDVLSTLNTMQEKMLEMAKEIKALKNPPKKKSILDLW